MGLSVTRLQRSPTKMTDRMFRSCNILSVILVGLLCSRVTDKHLKLSRRQLIVGTCITIAIIMFKLADPTAASKEEKTT